MQALGAAAEATSGTTGRLARANATRNPKRTSATASALMIGVALVGLITILAASTKASIADTLTESLQADFVVTGGAFGAGGLSPEIAADLSAVPGVQVVVPARATLVSVAGATTEVAGIDMASIDSVADVGVTGGQLADVRGATVAVEDRKAKADGLAIGDTLTMTFARTGPVYLTVGAFIDRPPPGFDGVVYVVDLATYEGNVTDQFDRQLFVNVADGVDAAELDAALDRWPNADLQDQATFGDSIRGQIDIILNLVYGLLALAVVIALIGIANTLALSVHERRRELGLLRAVGMSRSQVRAAVRWEAVMIALMGTFLGFVLAVAGGWGIVSAIEADRPIPFVVPPVQLTIIVVFAAVAGVVAAVGPGRRAAKLDVLTAIAS
jgi:putative ABC transport system permease protein